MCDFCKDTEGNLELPIASRVVKLGPLNLMFDAWIWNQNRKGKLWCAVAIGNETIFDLKVPIRYCPNCGRNLEV